MLRKNPVDEPPKCIAFLLANPQSSDDRVSSGAEIRHGEAICHMPAQQNATFPPTWRSASVANGYTPGASTQTSFSSRC